MATRWFRGGAGAQWNDVNSWAETEGGAVGASVPGASDYAYFSNTASASDCTMDRDEAISIMYCTSALTGGTDDYAANFNQAGYSLAAGRILWQAGGWIFGTGGQLTLTTANYSSFTGSTITPGTGTVVLNGCTALAGLLFYNVSVAATAGLGTVTLSRKLKVVAGKTATISNGDTVGILAGGSLEVEDTGTLSYNGTGKLQIFNTAAANIATTGTINCSIYFECGAGDCAPPARTYGQPVRVINDTATERTFHFEAGTYNFSSYLYPNCSSTGNIVMDGSTHNPTVNVTGKVDNIGTGSGTESWLLGSGTWTVGGGWDMTSGALTRGTSTVILNGDTKNWAGGTQTWNNVTISGDTTITGEVRVDGGTISIGDGFTLTPNATLRLDGSSALNLNTTGTLASGTGYLNLYTGAWANVTTGGTLNAMVQLLTDYAADNIKIPARTWGGSSFAIIHNRTAGNNRIVIMGTGAAQTLAFSGTFLLQASGAGNITLDGATYNPTANITGAVSSTKSSTGTVNWLLGTGTWTCGGNVNWTNATVTPSTSTLAMTGASAILTSAANSFYKLTISNDWSCADALSVTNMLTCITPSKTLTFKSGVTHVIADVTLDGQDAGTKIVLAPGTAATEYTWNLASFAAPTDISFVSVDYCVSLSPNTIVASNGTNTDGGHNTRWSFGAVTGKSHWYFARRRTT